MKLIVNAHPPGKEREIFSFGPFSIEEAKKAVRSLEDRGWTYTGDKPLNDINSPLGLAQNWQPTPLK